LLFIFELVIIAKWAATLRIFIWALFVFLLFAPMIVEFAFISGALVTVQRLFPFWENKPVTVVLSDILFIEAGVLIVFGALIAGVILYNSWAALDVRKVQFIEYIWNWRKIKEERNSPVGLTVGLTILAVGIIYLVIAIIASAGITPIP
jgi:sterol desaturase/sphingolipid hydroxylase (fatty acid hydroxylase superfamily)